jgi:L-fuconolactonase
MITFPIIDAHLHLWDINKLKYPWLNDIPALNKTFSLDDYNRACGEIKVEKMVFMQCECHPSQYTKEVEWITELSRSDSRIKGIVSWAPLEKGEAVRAEIELLKKNNLVKGVRRIIQFEPDLDFCLKPNFIRGINLLAEYDLTFDICISYIHNKNIIQFISKCPDIHMILDHIGKPDIKGKVLDPWRDEISEISKFPNVYCKLSSLATEADHINWTVDGIRPYVDHIIKSFGFDRLVFATDWPVSSLAASIPVCVNTLDTILKGCSQTELEKVFVKNALNFYRI